MQPWGNRTDINYIGAWCLVGGLPGLLSQLFQLGLHLRKFASLCFPTKGAVDKAREPLLPALGAANWA